MVRASGMADAVFLYQAWSFLGFELGTAGSTPLEAVCWPSRGINRMRRPGAVVGEPLSLAIGRLITGRRQGHSLRNSAGGHESWTPICTEAVLPYSSSKT